MALTCPLDLDTASLRTEIQSMYSRVVTTPDGVGNPHAIARIQNDSVILDVGCGAGTDLLLAARRHGPHGRAVGVDMTEAMRTRAAAGASAGFDDPRIVARFDCFAGTTKERTARLYGVVAVNLVATRARKDIDNSFF